MFKIDNPSERLVRAVERYLNALSASVEDDARAFDMALMLEDESVPGLKALEEEAQVKNANIEPILVRNTRGEPVQIQLYLWVNALKCEEVSK
jgi:hypothetical protein